MCQQVFSRWTVSLWVWLFLLVAGPAQAATARWGCSPASLGRTLHLRGGYFAAGDHSASVLELRMGLLCTLNAGGDPSRAGFQLIPEVSYGSLFENNAIDDSEEPVARRVHSLNADPLPERSSQTHLAGFGLSAGYGAKWASVGVAPRLLVGHNKLAGVSLGIDHSLQVRLLCQMLTIDLGHQVLHDRAGFRQGVTAGGSVNLLVLAALVASRGNFSLSSVVFK